MQEQLKIKIQFDYQKEFNSFTNDLTKSLQKIETIQNHFYNKDLENLKKIETKKLAQQRLFAMQQKKYQQQSEKYGSTIAGGLQYMRKNGKTILKNLNEPITFHDLQYQVMRSIPAMGMIKSISNAADFQKSITDIMLTLPNTSETIKKQVIKDIYELSGKIGKPIDDIAIGYKDRKSVV